MSSVSLRDGTQMPSVGLGCWKIAKPACADVVYRAIRSGYRLIDEAADYGNELEAGQGIRRALDEKLVTREELFVTSKLWNTHHRKEHVKEAVRKSLADLGLEYLDLYLIHFPISQRYVSVEDRYPAEWFFDPSAETPKMEEDLVSYAETWRAMEELVEEGLVRNIGACNIGTAMLRDVLSYAKIAPAVLQVELHPQLTQEVLLRFCKERGIAVTGFSSFGASSYRELGLETDDILLENSVVSGVAKALGKTTAQVLLRWAVQRGTAVIPKSSNDGRLAENLAVFDFELASDQMDAISALNQNRRFNDPGAFCEEAFGKFYPIYE